MTEETTREIEVTRLVSALNEATCALLGITGCDETQLDTEATYRLTKALTALRRAADAEVKRLGLS